MDERAPRKRRLFAGIELEPHARAACAAVAEQLRKADLAAKYESPEKLHATLAFLGFVDPSRVEEVTATLASCAKRSTPFDVTLDKCSAFPHERRPRVIYVGAREQGAAFRALAENVRNAYAALGFEFEDDAIAHVTIARIKESQRPLPLVDFAPIRLEIRELALFESLPDPAHKTSRYEIIASVILTRSPMSS